MEFPVRAFCIFRDDPRPHIAEFGIQIFGRIPLAGIQNKGGSACGPGFYFDGVYQCLCNSLLAKGSVHHEFGYLGAVASICASRHVKLDGAGKFIIRFCNQQNTARVFDGFGNILPISKGFFIGKGK